MNPEIPEAVADVVREAGARDAESFRARTEQSLASVHARINEQQSSRFTVPRWIPLAAAASLLLFFGWQFQSRVIGVDFVKPTAFQTARGEQKTFQLADGSEMILGPSSSVRFSNGSKQREVELQGQAYFRVKHNASIPFLVRARNAVATDIGTEFSVRSYPEDSSVSVAVAEGVVRLNESAMRDTGVVLNVGKVGTVVGSNVYSVSRDISSYTGWMSRRLVFENASLPSIAAELSRWFAVDVSVDPALSARRLSAVYDKPDLNAVLDAIAAASGARVQRNGNSIRLEETR